MLVVLFSALKQWPFQAALSARLTAPQPQYPTRTFAPDTLPLRCDVPVCLRHIIAAATAAAISRFAVEPGFIAA
ncbi:hypothetical protein SOW02_15650 [Pectobacterium actinidiae]|uniref:hypothetical protein n=1 Tax=Pectobacterium actinidiae TaxID=1507808 RepID=UPI002A7EAF0C|nr:hypothetical protein [Pectobacterium actinidiae]MDY4316366.1 hypothetical protein [Pectobacterium actinidiae]